MPTARDDEGRRDRLTNVGRGRDGAFRVVNRVANSVGREAGRGE